MTTTGLELLVVFGAIAAFLQTTTGFGGALVLAPVLFGTMRPAQAVLLAALLGTVQSAVLVVRYRSEILGHDVGSLLGWALPDSPPAWSCCASRPRRSCASSSAPA